MNWKYLFGGLLLSIFYTPVYSSYIDHNKQVFGVEFTLDHLSASVSLRNGSTYALSRVHGGEAYQSLMRKYLATCHEAHRTQTPPADQEEIRRSWYEAVDEASRRRNNFVSHPESSWYDAFLSWVLKRPEYSPEMFEIDPFTGDQEVEVLALAVERLKNATIYEMSHQLNETDLSSWPFASIIMPDFFWTHVKPDFVPDYPHLSWFFPCYDRENFFWLHHLFRKFTVALFRNKYRLDVDTDWKQIIDDPLWIREINAAAQETMLHTTKFYCDGKPWGSGQKGLHCDPRPSNLQAVVDYTNASMSFWFNGWTPWNTFTELGAHAVSNFDASSPDEETALLANHFNLAVERLHAFFLDVGTYDGEHVILLFRGEFWNERSIAIFKDLVSAHDGVQQLVDSIEYVHQPDIFAASKRIARQHRHYVDTAYRCTLDAPDEPPWDVLSGHDEL